MLFALGLVFVFGLGGFTGLFLADILADVYLHDTFFVVGHFHLTMSAAVLLGAFAAVYFWFPKMFGRMMNERLGQVHFALTLVTIVVTFGGQLLLGYAGMQRRLPDPSAYAFLRPLIPLNRLVSNAAFVMGAAQSGGHQDLDRLPQHRPPRIGRFLVDRGAIRRGSAEFELQLQRQW